MAIRHRFFAPLLGRIKGDEYEARKYHGDIGSNISYDVANR